MNGQCEIRDIIQTDNSHYLITLLCNGDSSEADSLRGNVLDVVLVKHRKKRSVNANSYLWKICDEIAKKIGSTYKDRVYVELLKDYGVWEDVMVKDTAAGDLIRLTKYCEIMYELDGWTCLRIYHGSHEYDTAEMSRLIDGAVAEAKLLGIETMTPDEIERLKAAWKGAI